MKKQIIPIELLEIVKAMKLSNSKGGDYPRYEVQSQSVRPAYEGEDHDYVAIIYDDEEYKIESESDLENFYCDEIESARSDHEANPEDSDIEERLEKLEESLEEAKLFFDAGEYDDMCDMIKDHYDGAYVTLCVIEYKTESIHLSKSAARAYIANHPYRLTRPRLYVESNHNSYEMRTLHDWLMSLDVEGVE